MTLILGDCLEQKSKKRNYGMPYMGSKSAIVKDLLNILPKAESFYDLFGGGGSVSHCAVVEYKNKWQNVYYNEIDSSVAGLVKDSIAGKYSYDKFKPPFITREEFQKNKDSCAYIRCIWSFGNNQKNYLFGKDIEQRKQSLHNAVIFETFDDLATSFLDFKAWPENLSTIKGRRLFIRKKVQEKLGLNAVEQLQQLQQLQHLQQLERLQQLQQLQQLEVTSFDYAMVSIKKNSIIYCDIPYKYTAGYLYDFDYDRFFDWAANHKTPVFISEFNISDERFKCIFEKERAQRLYANAKDDKRRLFTEKIYANKSAVEYMAALLDPEYFEIAKKRIK